MSVSDLVGCCIVERDENDETLLVWAFPTITKQQEHYVLRKYNSLNLQRHPFAFTRYCKEWFYFNITQVFISDSLPQVKFFCFVLWAKDYNPDKYENLCKVLSKRYCKTGNPSSLLQLYLSVMTKGVCSTEENGIFLTSDFEFTKKKEENVFIKELIKLFGLETILIYTALLLNRRLIIYHHSLESLLKWIKTIPLLMIHRDFEDITFPWVHLETEELIELKCCDGFIAGCIENELGELSEMFDIFVNLPAREVTISPHSRDYFVMTKIHKDIALFMVQLSEKGSLEEVQVVDEIASKTKELLDQLSLLACTLTPDGLKVISVETLREKNLPPALESFLFNLSVAEKMILL